MSHIKRVCSHVTNDIYNMAMKSLWTIKVYMYMYYAGDTISHVTSHCRF